ncbi:YadA-like family protein [Escherichia coli]|nr:YadA-like family protein [Escherichia coli]MCN7469505.1 YadA-like family protein [Escherichia coli]MCV0754071.1 YadA-like family protein [Escherichia coli]MCV1472358.1 YadA-like family protein [Escherichia coli]
MNKIFKVIWNPATGSYTVASETAKSRGKKSGRSKLLISALVVGGLLSSGVQASTALDGGGASESTPLTDTWIAIGQGAKASSVDTSPSGGPGTSSIAIGQEAQSGIGSTSLGFKSQATGERSVALGQTADATGNRAIAIGSGAKSTADYSLTLGNGSKAFAENATAIGKDARAEGKGSQAFGKVALATGENAIALGSNSNASGDNAVALGSTSQAYGDSSLAIGELSETNAENAIALGKLSNASKINSIALGSNSTASGVGSVALGENSFAGGINSLALGSQSNANGDNAVALGVGSVAEQDNTVSVGNSTTQRKITNMAAGLILPGSTEAINGSQLHALSASVAARLGAGAGVNGDGSINAPSYKLKSGTYNNVGEALLGIDNDTLHWDKTEGAFSASYIVKNADGSPKSSIAQNKIINVAKGTISATSTDVVNGSQLYDLQQDALLWNGTAFSAAHGKDKTASVITNVANGAVSATSSDAINGSQLYSTNKYIADALGGDAEVNADGTITAPTYTIANTDYNNVGEALDALDNNALLWDATANNGAGAYSASHDGKASIITNVADGNIGEDSTDAINGSQLNATNMMIQQNSEIINQLAGDTSKNYIGDNGAGINYVRTNDSGLAFNDASAAGIGSTAVGYNTVAKGDSSVAIGHGSNSIVETSIALGSESVSSRLIVKGSRNTRVTENGVEIGYDTTDGELLGALSIGDDGKYRQIINVADGSEAHDAVTVRQLQNAIGAVATTPTKYYHANSTAEDSLAVGEDSLAMGAKTIVNGNAGIGIGLNTLVLADAINGIAIGSNARANHADSIAMGNGSQTTRGAQTNYTAYNMDAPQNSVGEFSVGSEDGQRQITNVAAGSADTDAVNVGQLKVTDAQVSQNTQSITNLNTQVTNLDTRVTNIENGIGDIVTTGSTKYFKTNTDGADANAQGKDSVAIGSGSIAAADNSVALGTGSVADEENTISVGSSTNQRRITNVAAGVNATDAVNVSQLKSSEAGGVRYDTKADGSIDYSNITLGGGNGGTTRISNVSAGVNNNDAVNYAQLKQSVQETKQYTDQRMVEMDNKLSKTESKLSGGIASAMAMTGLPQAYTPGASMASIGGGTYNGESAVALGVSMVSANGRWVYKLQGSTNSQGEYSAALGAGIQW